MVWCARADLNITAAARGGSALSRRALAAGQLADQAIVTPVLLYWACTVLYCTVLAGTTCITLVSHYTTFQSYRHLDMFISTGMWIVDISTRSRYM